MEQPTSQTLSEAKEKSGGSQKGNLMVQLTAHWPELVTGSLSATENQKLQPYYVLRREGAANVW